ncbi:hypothetical protein VNI00_001946 [Paramarasmius palmivorus]|uniref:Chalcone isomerase domain-containing protein n=1 Tax=Paramarasmius palmivorus TaxID=297713 RepID=A0AAW0E403_9AGAR
MSFLYSSLTRSVARSALSRPSTFHAPRQAFRTASARQRPFFTWKPILVGAGIAVAATLVWGPSVHLDAVIPPTQAEVNANVTADGTDVTVDPATGIEFPNIIRVAAKTHIPLLTLVGLGVRTVSFLGIKVYSVALYADLRNPNLKFEPNMTPDQKIEHIIRNSACVIRIVPTRSTSYSHLRDAFMRAMQARMNDGRKNGTLTEENAMEVASPVRKLKTLFPNTALAKHTPFDIFLSQPTPGKPRALIFRDLGAIENDWVATEFVLHYFEGDGPSPPLKKSVVERVSSL